MKRDDPILKSVLSKLQHFTIKLEVMNSSQFETLAIDEVMVVVVVVMIVVVVVVIMKWWW